MNRLKLGRIRLEDLDKVLVDFQDLKAFMISLGNLGKASSSNHLGIYLMNLKNSLEVHNKDQVVGEVLKEHNKDKEAKIS